MRATTLLKRMGERLWYARDRVPILNAPVPWRLPYGGWFLAHGDPMGARVAGYRLSGHPYEEADWKFVRRHLPVGGTFIDVGANQGFFTILASRRVGPAGKVIAFEPATPEARKLRANLLVNRAGNVRVESVAVGAEEGWADFHLYPRQGPWSSLREAGEGVTTAGVVVKVRVTTLDEYCARHRVESVNMIKIDVEGGELDVLKGAQALIARARPLILCEVQLSRTEQWGYRPEEIVAALKAQAYTLVGATGDGVAVSVDDDLARWQNLIAVPEERMGRLVGSVPPGS